MGYRGEEQRWGTEVGNRGGEQRWGTEVGSRGGVEKRCRVAGPFETLCNAVIMYTNRVSHLPTIFYNNEGSKQFQCNALFVFTFFYSSFIRFRRQGAPAARYTLGAIQPDDTNHVHVGGATCEKTGRSPRGRELNDFVKADHQFCHDIFDHGVWREQLDAARLGFFLLGFGFFFA